MNDFWSANFSVLVSFSSIKKFSGERGDVLFLDEYQTYNATTTTYAGLNIILYSDRDGEREMQTWILSFRYRVKFEYINLNTFESWELRAERWENAKTGQVEQLDESNNESKHCSNKCWFSSAPF